MIFEVIQEEQVEQVTAKMLLPVSWQLLKLGYEYIGFILLFSPRLNVSEIFHKT